MKPFLNLEFKNLNTIKNPFGVASVDQSARLNVEQFFSDFQEYLLKNDFLIEEQQLKNELSKMILAYLKN